MGRERDAAQPKGEGMEPDAVRYAAAVEEIEALLASIDRDEIDVDELGAKVERAVQLLKVCRAKLKATEARVVEVLKDLDDDEAAAEVASAGSANADPLALASEGGADDDASPRKRKRKKGPAAGPSSGPGSAPLDPDEELPF